jgi:hypothetical protein
VGRTSGTQDEKNEQERRGLEARAAKYRKLQIEALAKLPAPEKRDV